MTRSSGARQGRAQSDVVYLDAPEPTDRFLQALGGVRELALDTEGASFHRFIDRVYLLQLTTRGASAIIDPLSAGPLPSLGRLVEDPAIEVVFHDADYDLRLLHQDYGWRVRRIFDTRVAAQLLGIRAFGLAALLEREFAVKLDKKHQRADWSMRPLSADMLEYAAQDTKWLLDLRDRLREQLEKKERWAWAAEEFERLEGTRWEAEADDAAFMRVKGARDLSRRELALLRELVQWRDGVASELDRATFRVAGNEVLLEIARRAPATREELAAIKGVPRGSLESRGGDILAAVQRGLAVAEADLPRFPRAPRWDRDPDFDARVSRLKTVRDGAAATLDLDPGVLCSRERMEAVARKRPTSMEELTAMPELRRWQIDVLGDRFLKALREGTKAAPAAAAAAPAGALAKDAAPVSAAPAAQAGAGADEESPYKD